MRKLLMVGAVLAAVVFPTASHAQFQLGLRLGYGLGMGDYQKDFSMSDSAKSQIPLQLDAMYKVTPEIAVGAYVSYGFAQPGGLTKEVCDLPGADCSFSTLRLGAQAAYTFTKVSPTFVPWAGVGLGWESVSYDFGGGSESATGFEFLNLQVGGDYKVAPKFAVGPYAQFSIGQYSNDAGASIEQKAMHEWLSFGLRGKFDL
jgi:hypothetical protein